MISIVIPAYNSELYLTETINSVLSQTYKDFELIIVNDGSTDNTSEIIQYYSNIDGRIKYIQQENQGVSSARNNGVKASSFKYIAFLDSDDLWIPNKLYEFIMAIKDNRLKDEDKFIIYSNYTSFKFDSVQKINCNVVNSQNDIFISNPICTSTVLISKDLFNNAGGFSNTYNGTEDWDLWLKCAEMQAQFYHVNKYLTHYRILETSLSRSYKKHYLEKLKVYHSHKKMFDCEVAKISLFEIEYENLSNHKRHGGNNFFVFLLLIKIILKFRFDFCIFALNKKGKSHD